MKPSHKAYELAMKYEGFTEKPELDLAPEGEKRQYRIGYGTLSQWGDKSIDWDGACIYLYDEMNQAWACIKSHIVGHVYDKLTQGQVDALTDFSFNVGSDSDKIPTLLNALNSGDMKAAADAILLYDKVTKDGVKQVSEHQKKRRQEERTLFLS